MGTNNILPAKFRLDEYIVSDTVIRLTGNKIGNNLQFGIDPEGKFDKEGKKFVLTLHIIVCDDEKNLDLSMTIKGIFEYDTDNMDELKSFLCINAPAILFPYIRAYISNVTALGGMKPLILPTLNIEGVGRDLLNKMSACQ